MLLSQFPVGSRTFPSSFLARNRLMAIVSHAAVIIEAGDTSGAPSHAAEIQRFGKPLFIAKSALSAPGLTWHERFLTAGATLFEDPVELLRALQQSVAA